MSPDRVTVVIPTYNEAENLAHLVAAVLLHGYSLVVVDDASPDGTGRIADEIARPVPGFQVVHRPAKQGLGSAYADGFDLALEQRAEIVVEMDADFSHDPGDLPRLVGEIIAGADVCIGSRYVAGGSTPDWPLLRRWVSRGGNTYARIMLGIPIRDATAGFRAFDANALRTLPYRSAEASGYGFQVEMVWRAHQEGFSIVEIPITFRDRTEGTSKMGPGIVAEAMWLVTKWALGRLRFWSR